MPREKGRAPVGTPPVVDGHKLGEYARLDKSSDCSDKAAALGTSQRPHLLTHPHVCRRAAPKGAAHDPRRGRRCHRGGGGGGGRAGAGGCEDGGGGGRAAAGAALRPRPSRGRGSPHQYDQDSEPRGTCQAPPPRAGGEAAGDAAPDACPRSHGAESAMVRRWGISDEGEAPARVTVTGMVECGRATKGRGRDKRTPVPQPRSLPPRVCLVRLPELSGVRRDGPGLPAQRCTPHWHSFPSAAGWSGAPTRRLPSPTPCPLLSPTSPRPPLPRRWRAGRPIPRSPHHLRPPLAGDPFPMPPLPDKRAGVGGGGRDGGGGYDDAAWHTPPQPRSVRSVDAPQLARGRAGEETRGRMYLAAGPQQRWMAERRAAGTAAHAPQHTRRNGPPSHRCAAGGVCRRGGRVGR